MGKTLKDYREGTVSSEISFSARVSIFDMLHSFAPRYSHPSIRHLQPSLMLRPCKTGQSRGCGHTQTFLKRFRCQLRVRQANMKNPAGPKVRAKTFYDVFSWQQVTKNITWDSDVCCQCQNNLYRVCWNAVLYFYFDARGLWIIISLHILLKALFKAYSTVEIKLSAFFTSFATHITLHKQFSHFVRCTNALSCRTVDEKIYTTNTITI